VRELAKDDRFAAPEIENTLAERGSCGLAQNPFRSRVWATRYVFSEEANGTAKGDHLVDERIGAKLIGIGSGVCRDKAKDRSSVAKALKGANGGLVSPRLAPFVSVAGESLDADEEDNVLALGDAPGGLRRYERAVGDREEEEASVVGHEFEHVVPQERLSTGDDNRVDTQLFRFGEESIEFVG
jgi:hypothetical protein